MRVLTIVGTRPEAIKMAPVILALESNPQFESIVCSTGQHREMLRQVMDVFSIRPDVNLDIMTSKQTLGSITSAVLAGVEATIQSKQPDIVLVHGDTTTCFASALAAFYQNVSIGHVEAGLRTGDIMAPYPEEANRSLVARLAKLHFAPTESSRQNLINENIDPSNIFVTGNTVIDALVLAQSKASEQGSQILAEALNEESLQQLTDRTRKTILITGHRRENFGQGFIDLCSAISTLAERHSDWNFIYPVHLNPNVQEPVNQFLAKFDNIHLIPPMDYLPFVWLMDHADIILTDSGGVQEEGPSLGKPVLVMRDVTERPEAVDAGTVKLVGTSPQAIIKNVEALLLDQKMYDHMSRAINPYGDGFASDRIIAALTR